MRTTPHDTTRPSRGRRRFRRLAVMTAGLFGVGVALSACGGPATPGVATGSATTTTAAPTSSGAGQGTGVLAYATCMRAHGVTKFPDPSSSGGINDKRTVINAMEAVSPAVGNSAQRACMNVLPPGESLGGQPPAKPITAQDQQYYLRAVACMRSHGFPTFPDPVFSGGSMSLPPTPSVNTNSPLYARSKALCEKLIPAGLPDSGNG